MTPVVTLGFTREELDAMEAAAWPDSIESWIHEACERALAVVEPAVSIRAERDALGHIADDYEQMNKHLIAVDEAACALIGLLRHALPEGAEAKGIDYPPYRRYREARAATSSPPAEPLAVVETA